MLGNGTEQIGAHPSSAERALGSHLRPAQHQAVLLMCVHGYMQFANLETYTN